MYVLGGAEHRVRAGNVVVVPPKSSIYFKGRFHAVLVAVPRGRSPMSGISAISR